MDLGELRDWVARSIKRPELAEDIKDAINAAIEYASTQGDYAWDLVEGAEAISATDYAQSLVISQKFPQFRKMKYLRPAGYNRYLIWKDPSRIFSQGVEAVNVWYRSGDNIIFKLSDLQSSLLYGYYSYPARLTDDDEFNNYTEQMPAAIHALACSYLYDQIGNEAESQRLERKATKFLFAHRNDKQDGVSHS